MSGPSGDIQAQLDQLRQEFLQGLPPKIAQLEQVLRRWQDSGEEGALRQSLGQAHKLAGAGSTFGFPEVSQTARDMENALSQLLATKQPVDEAAHAATDHALAALRDAVAAASVPGASAPAVFLNVTPEGDSAAQASKRAQPILLVEDDTQLASHLTLQLGYFGYRLLVIDSPERLARIAADSAPAAIIMDIGFPQGELAGPTELIGQKKQMPPNVPVIFLSSRRDFQARLAAVRAGSAAYLEKPVDLSALVNTLDTLTAKESANPSRILIVDDEETVAGSHSEVLKAAGLLTRVLNDPSGIDEALKEIAPDLILMDVYMPECTGIELATVIRQQEAFVSVPIVFLSAETNLDQRMLALRQGGDDFLTKPVDPSQLVSVVRSRIQRFRMLRSALEHDGLTGLLNHSKLKDRLEIEVLRSKRSGAPLTFAMIDLDDFKSVNDVHGHAAGDRVLISLAKLLLQRLRRTDIAGRYGGEEFAVILPETDSGGAHTVLEAVRRAFSTVHHVAGQREFRVTLSCGLAEFPAWRSAEAIASAADAALYRAKREGKNRVVVAAAPDDMQSLAPRARHNAGGEVGRSVAASGSL